MNKTYLVYDHEGQHEYDIVVEETEKGYTKCSIFRSQSDMWYDGVKGEFIMSMTDDGNGVKFKESKKEMDYADLECLRLLVNFYREIDTNEMNKKKHRIVENNPIFEI